MSSGSLTDTLKQEAKRLGFSDVGVCPAAEAEGAKHLHSWLQAGCHGEMAYMAEREEAYTHPGHVLDGAQSLLMLTMDYRTEEPAEEVLGQGRVSRYAWATDYHDVIRDRLHRLADFHRTLTPDAQVRGIVDTAPLLEREYAQLAGLGWIGKNTMLLNRSHGSWFFLAALLTSETLEYDTPFQADHCGTCRACLDACPTGALIDAHRLDARRCISYLTIELREMTPPELREPTGSWLFGCDVCQDVCPWNRKAPVASEAAFSPREGLNGVELASLFLMDDDTFRAKFRHTPLWRSKRRGILRNAAIVLGNQRDEQSLPGLLRGVEDAEPLVRAASAWALGQFRCETARLALEQRITVEEDPDVRYELEEQLAG